MKRQLLAAPLCLAAALGVAAAVQYAPPPPVPPAEAKLKEIDARIDKLNGELAVMRRKGTADFTYADVEVFLKAARWIRKYGEFYQKDAADWTLAVLDNGLLRASQQLRGEAPWLNQTGYSVARGYRSAVDGSVQPYAVSFPADYGRDPTKRWRLDVVLHGRNASLTEVSFLNQHNGNRTAPKDLDHVQLDIYGRGNNAYRWAGESDVLEALDHFLGVETRLGRDRLLDPNRFVLRGFSMGGAGSWHLGLHHPDRWCVVGPGAGFTATHGYLKDLPKQLPPEQEACLTIYDAVDYAENVFDVPVVAYGGADDPQLQAARNIQDAVKQADLTVPLTVLVAPGLKHEFPREWQKKAEDEYAKYLAKGRPENPPRVRFVTYTLKYPRCYWLEILALEKHYRRTLVDAKATKSGYEVKTENVRVLDIALPPTAVLEPVKVGIDGQEMDVKPAPLGRGLHVFLERRAGRWSAILPERFVTDRQRNLTKIAGLQGPIDDAFTNSFLAVQGTGQPWHDATRQYAEANLRRFMDEWSRYFRGDLPVKLDTEVTPADLAGRHLILFGDPASNSLIEQALSGLPFQWTKETITWDGKDYPAAEHVPVLIYPSPLNAERYVVLNSGHTFHAADFQGTNALLYPRLGDHALLKLDRTKKDPLAAEVIKAGLFDDHWRFGAPNFRVNAGISAVIQCPVCKQMQESGVRFCPHDGTPLSDTAEVTTVTTPTVVRPVAKELQLPVVVGARYRLEQFLGGGGMAKVYRGVDLTLERAVAVKLISAELRADPEFDARFQREARIASQLGDPHIVVVHDFGIDAALGPFLVMELLQGVSLRERLQSQGPLPLKPGLQLGAQLMLALIHAHEKGIVHRDIKPDNIFLLNQSGIRLHVRVLDFGIARMFRRGETADAETLTQAGAVLGTPRYMAPEQLAGQPADARSDLYSAGLVMYEAFTGQLPYASGKKFSELCAEASPVLQEVIDHCLRPNPQDRPSNAVEVYLRLQELGKASGILLLPPGAIDRLAAAHHGKERAQAPPPAPRPPGAVQRRFLYGMAALLVLVGLLALGKYLFFNAPPPAPPTEAESLLGVKIGDPQQQVVNKLTLTKGGPINPWADAVPPYLGHALRADDLGLGEEDLKALDVQRTADDYVCVLFHRGKVAAVVAREGHKGATGRGIALRGNVSDLYNVYSAIYPGDPTEHTIELPDKGKKHAVVRRYDRFGVGFLIQGKEIVEIALYPAKDAP